MDVGDRCCSCVHTSRVKPDGDAVYTDRVGIYPQQKAADSISRVSVLDVKTPVLNVSRDRVRNRYIVEELLRLVGDGDVLRRTARERPCNARHLDVPVIIRAVYCVATGRCYVNSPANPTARRCPLKKRACCCIGDQSCANGIPCRVVIGDPGNSGSSK